LLPIAIRYSLFALVNVTGTGERRMATSEAQDRDLIFILIFIQREALMNFSQVITEGDVALELKYCERCGGLWLRTLGDEESYCENCRAALAAWPRMGGRRRAVRHGVRRETALTAQLDEGQERFVVETLLGVAELAGENGEPTSLRDVAEVRV
jgi:hypothetical protein